MSKNKAEIACILGFLLSMLLLYVPVALEKPETSNNFFKYTRLEYTSPFEQAGIVTESFMSILESNMQKIGYAIYGVTSIVMAYIESKSVKEGIRMNRNDEIESKD